ncbi:elongation factor 1-beta [Syncephalis plumigaleata]|nr:elongation factor 1-beta [Syncephalis plumigaleata]
MSLSDASLKSLNDFLEDKSYIEGTQPSKSDVVVFKALGKEPAANFAHAARCAFPGEAKELNTFSFVKAEDDDIDLFGSDDEVDEEAERVKAERLAAYHAKKATKPVVIAKSMITFDVKPWDDETDLKAMEAGVRAIEMDGLVWGTSKLVPVGYGINKLRIACVVEDAKVSTDVLEEQIRDLEDYVQSIDIEAFSKI